MSAKQPPTADLTTLIRALSPRPARRKGPDIPAMPRLPAGLFPESVTAFLSSAAITTRTSPELVAFPFLALTGALVGNRATLEIGTGWIEHPTLWVALVAPSGGGKTPALTAATEPFRQLEASLALPDHGLITAETSPTRIADHLATRPGVAVVQDELVGLVRALNQSRRADDRQRMLSLWSSHPIATNHSTRAIEHPVVSVIGGIQSRVAPRLRSRDQDGLIERFLPIVADPIAAYWSEAQIARRVTPDLAPLLDWLTPLARLKPMETSPLRITRSPEAATHWASWYNTNVDRCHAAPASIRGFYLKLPAQVARLALILHLLWHPTDPAQPLNAATMQRAADLGEFIRVHMHRLAILLGHTGHIPTEPTPTLERRILRALAETANPDGWVPRTELYECLGRPARPTLAAALETLIAQRAIVSRTERPSGPGRPITTYRLA